MVAVAQVNVRIYGKHNLTCHKHFRQDSKDKRERSNRDAPSSWHDKPLYSRQNARVMHFRLSTGYQIML